MAFGAPSVSCTQTKCLRRALHFISSDKAFSCPLFAACPNQNLEELQRGSGLGERRVRLKAVSHSSDHIVGLRPKYVDFSELPHGHSNTGEVHWDMGTFRTGF